MSTPISFEDAMKPLPGNSPTPSKGLSFEDAMRPEGESPAKGFGGHLKDAGLSLAKGIVAVPEAAVGLADIVSGGRAGKFLENADGAVGFRPKQAKEFLNELHTDGYKDQQRQFQEADGILAKTGVALSNPSMIANTVIESAPSIGAGGVAARGLMAATRLGQMGAKGAAVAGAAGEGISMAGSQAEAIRQETPDGLLTPGQSGIAAATGVMGGVVGGLSGRLANKLGVGNVETMLAQGTKGMNQQFANDAAAAAVNPLVAQKVAKSLPRQVVEGAITEGLLEELPQSAAEQILQNLALDKPWQDGLDDAIVMGALSGGAMGAGAAGFHAYKSPVAGPASASPAEPQSSPAGSGGTIDPATQAMPGEVPPADVQAQAAEPAQEPAPANTDPSSYAPEQAAPTMTAGPDGAGQGANAQDAQFPVDTGGDVIDTAPPVAEPVRPSEAMGLDANAGALSAAAVVAVDSGASEQVAAAAQAKAEADAQAQEAKTAKAGKKTEQGLLQEAAARTTTAEQPALSPMEEAGLASTLAGSELPTTSLAGSKEQELQARLEDVKQRAVANGSWNVPLMGQRRLIEDALANLAPTQEKTFTPEAPSAQQSVPAAQPVTPGASLEPQATQTQQAIAQPAQPATQARAPADADAGQPAGGVADAARAKGLTNAAPPQNNGAQGPAAPGAQGQAKEQAQTEALRQQLRAVEDKILAAAPPAIGQGGGDIEAAMKSRKVPLPLKAQRKKLKEAVASAGISQPAIETVATTSPTETVPTGATGPLGEKNQPMAAGGKPFKTRKAAVDAKKLQPRAGNGQLADRQEGAGQGAPEDENAKVAEQIRVADRSFNTTQRLAAAYRGEPYKGVKEDYKTLRADLDARASDKNFSDQGLAQDVLERFDDSIANLKIRENAKNVAASAQPASAKDKNGVRSVQSADAVVEPVKAELSASKSVIERAKKSKAEKAEKAEKEKAPKVPAKRESVVARRAAAAAEATAQARADHYNPGNIVKSYGGHDRVIGYQPSADGKAWSVTVQAVVKQGNEWVDDPSDDRVRQHSTEPEPGELKAGPVQRAQVATKSVATSAQPVSAAGQKTAEPDAGNDDIRFSFAGQNAATADQHSLATAQARLDAGEDAEGVRQDTGWSKGTDGKWRFEISDADALLKDRAQWTESQDNLKSKEDAAYQAKFAAEYARNDFLRARGESPSRISSDTKKTPEFKTLAKALTKAEAVVEKARDALRMAKLEGSAVTVGSMVSHPTLFAAYPGLAQLKVEVRDGMPANNASYTYESKTIEVSGKSSNEQVLSTLLHELQHGIQHVEGFAMGGSPTSATGYDAQVSAELTDLLQASPRLQAIYEEWAGYQNDMDAGRNFDVAAAEKVEVALEATPDGRKAMDLHGTLEGLSDPDSAPSVIQNRYRRLAGEVEARNTQARQGMTNAERRATPPEATADVKASDVIVTFNGKEAQSAPVPANTLQPVMPPVRRSPAPLTDAASVRNAVAAKFPELARSIDRMLARGELAQKGGLVVIESADARDIAQVYASKTDRTLATALRLIQGDAQLSEAGDIQGFYDPKSGLQFIVAPNVTARTVPAVTLHEAVHGQQRADLDAKAQKMLDGRADKMQTQKTREFLARVAQRIDDSGETGNTKEVFPYIVEQAALEGRQAGFSKADSRFLAWVDATLGKGVGNFIRDLVATVRANALKRGFDLTPSIDDLVELAKMAVHTAADGTVVTSKPRATARPAAPALSRAGAGSHTDRAVMDMVREGRTAQDILRLVAGTSKSRFNKQVARLLLKTGANPTVSLERGTLGGDGHFTFLARYSRKNDALGMTEGAQAQAEHIFMHEMVHAATLKALDRKGLASLQMRRLYEHVKKQGGANGQYGMKNVGEFVAEVFTNPEFQREIKGMSAPSGSTLKTAWDSFVRIMRSILGLNQDSTDALSRALELGVAVMRENMSIRTKASGADAYIADPNVVSEIQLVLDGARAQGHAPQKAVFGRAADWLVKSASVRGVDVEDFRHVLDGSAVRHMMKNHYDLKGEKSRGQIPLTDADLLALPSVVQNPDRVVLGTKNRLGREQIAYVKQLPDGSTLYLEEVRTGRKELAAVSARKYPATMNVESIVSTLHPNARGDGGNGAIVLRSPAEGNTQGSGVEDAHFGSAELNNIKTKALDQIHQTLSHPGKVSLWDKTVGTMRHLAERNPAFKPVFESAQQRIDDVSTMANDAADAAPRILPRVDDMGDIFGKNRKKPVAAADNKAIGKALFEGTLSWARDDSGKPVLVNDLKKRYADLSAEEKAQMMLASGALDAGVLKMWRGLPIAQFENLINSNFDSKMLKAGVVWSDKELKTLMGMNDLQVGLYREARAAVDRSIDMTSRAAMLRLAGDKYAAMRDVVLEQPTLQDAMELLTSTLMEDAKAEPDASDLLMQQHNQVVDLATKARDLMESGYMPLSRFGKYTLDVVDADGQRQYFSMFESQRDANLMKLKMQSVFPGATVVQGTMSAEAFKLFQGVTPESLEMFGNMLGLESTGGEAKDKAFQAYVQLAKNNHSSLKRLIHRKGIDGYSEDVGRTLASFIYSNARQAAGALNAGTMEKAVQAIPKEQGELVDVAMGLRSYISDPQEEGQAVRGMLFAQYLGGSVASAFVNMTQPFAVTMPWLSQFGGIKKAGGQMARALKDMGTKGFKYEADLAKAMKDAEDDGTVSPQEVHQLMAQARGAGGLRSGDGTRKGEALAQVSNAWEKTKVGWGQPFALAEQFNRRSTFIAAFRIAKDQGMANPAEFARKAVLETQFLYSKANKMKWARGTVGGTLMCVDDTTEALTQRGWVGPDDLRPGDMLASFDMATERLIWAPMKSVHIFDHDGEMVHAQSKTLDMFMTPDHRVVHYKEKRTKGAKRGTTHWELGIAEAQDIPVSHRVQIPTAAPFDHVPVGDPITDAQAKMLGWVVTEGWFTKKNRGREEWGGALKLYQNEGRTADLIRADLLDAGLEYTETNWSYKGGNALHVRFNIKKTSAAALREMLPDKQLTPALLMRMTTAQIEHLVDRMIEGDGSESPTGQRCLIQNPGQTLETFQMALTILGKSFRVSKHGPNCRKVLIREPSNTEAGRYSVKKSERVQYTGRVWCPLVPGTSTWVARRNGMPFITHNTFKTYSISYLELMQRTWNAGTPGSPERAAGRRAVAWAMVMLMLMGGAGGLPFMEDAEDLIDALAQMLGYNVSSKQWRKQAMEEIVGKELAEFLDQGISGLPGAPIDVSGRLGMGNLIPGTGLFQTKPNHTRDMLELAGPAGDLVGRAFSGAGRLLKGDIAGAALEVAPTAVRNAAKGVDMASSGMYKDTKGYKVIDTTLDEAIAKAIGFQPRSVAEVQEANSFMLRSKGFYTQTSSEIRAQWADALFRQDDAALDKVRGRLDDWNKNNPDQRISIQMPDIWKRVREMGKDRTQRIADTAPKALRARMREDAAALK